jgi:hypothetical protein
MRLFANQEVPGNGDAMTMNRWLPESGRTFPRAAARWLAMAVGGAAAAYATFGGITWIRFGYRPRSTPESADPFLDRFVPIYDVAERHHIRVGAPAEITFAAACECDPLQSSLTGAIFRAREVILGSESDGLPRPHGLLALTKSIGWGVLAEVPGREVVMGAVTQPWEADVTFHCLPPDDFAAFDEPGYVKIAWTLRADPITARESVFRTETRAVATCASARARFRRYWSFFAPGIIAIRWLMLRPVKAEAEGRARSRNPAARLSSRADREVPRRIKEASCR